MLWSLWPDGDPYEEIQELILHPPETMMYTTALFSWAGWPRTKASLVTVQMYSPLSSGSRLGMKRTPSLTLCPGGRARPPGRLQLILGFLSPSAVQRSSTDCPTVKERWFGPSMAAPSMPSTPEVPSSLTELEGM